MSAEHGHDLITRFTTQASIVPGIKTPGFFETSGLSSIVARVRYAFCFVGGVTGSQLRMRWKVQRNVSPNDNVAIPGTRIPAFTPVVGNLYFSRLAHDQLRTGELSLPSPESEFGGPEKITSLFAEWEVVGGTNLTLAFWEVALPAQQFFPDSLQINGFGSGLLEQDSNGNDHFVSDLATIPPNPLMKPNGNPVLT